jgi:methylmalonyl-CoA mutase N-terminal domain/subunit
MSDIDTTIAGIEAGKQKWEGGAVAKTIAKFPEQKKAFVTASGKTVERLYTPEASTITDYAAKLGYPGSYPFTRGVQPTMYRGRFWTMRQYAGFATAEESNQRYKYLLSQGTTGLSVAFDLPTQIGYDSDDTMSIGEVGKVGVAIDSLADMETLFDGIPLDKVSTSMTINSTAAILLAMYIAVGEKQGVSADKLNGTIQNDILKEYIARGTYRFPPKPSLRLISDIFAYCTSDVPNWNTISISGYHIREAGSTAAQEIGFTLADAICYVETAQKAGLKVDDFAPRLAFFFAAHSDLFEEVAKFRAARRLYAKIMKQRFGASDKSAMLRFHTQTGGVTLTAQQPDNNVVRVAIQALSAVLGAAHQLQGRGPRAAHRRVGHHRASHAANHRPRIRCRQHDRSAGGQLLCRKANRRTRSRGRGVDQEDRRDGRHGRGDRARVRPKTDRGIRLPIRPIDRVGRPGDRRRQQVPVQGRGQGRSV